MTTSPTSRGKASNNQRKVNWRLTLEGKLFGLCVEKSVLVTLQERRKLKCKRKHKARTLAMSHVYSTSLQKECDFPNLDDGQVCGLAHILCSQCFHVKQNSPALLAINQSFQKAFLGIAARWLSN